LELKTIAILRLVFPEALIPASLDIEGLRGLSDRLDAGANVITSIIPPETGLAGVAQSYMDVDGGGRTVEQVRNVLKVKDLSIGSIDEYKKLLEKYKGKSGK
jgi:methylornithine synthase